MYYSLSKMEPGCNAFLDFYSKLTEEVGESALSARYFVHYGDSLVQCGRRDEAEKVSIH